jgi:CubicO group peptidase (beta-lactamase class C family)
MRGSFKKQFFLLSLIMVMMIGVGGTTLSADEDDWPIDGWPTTTPEEQGMDSALLVDMFEAIESDNPGIDSLLIVRNGKLVVESYIAPFDVESAHIIHSCTKSIVSTLIGIAIDQAYIENVDVPVLDLFPDHTFDNVDAGKEAMTLEHLLMMAGGLECRDSYLYQWGGLRRMISTDDWPQYVLDLPMEYEPGTHFEYCNGGSHTLSAIIEETTGTNTLEFAQEHLFDPLGITDIDWPADPQGINIGWGEVHLRPVDMAKIGYLFLSEGVWDDEQIVSAEWVAAATSPHIPATLSDNYGYQWWVDDEGYYMALGYAGQFIYVVPDQELVVVFVSDLPDRAFFYPESLLNRYIIPAADSTTPLPENADAVAELAALIKALGPLDEE